VRFWLLYEVILHMRKESHWMEWALILDVGESLEKEAMSRPLDLGLKNKKCSCLWMWWQTLVKPWSKWASLPCL